MDTRTVWLALGGDTQISPTEAMLLELASLTKEKSDALDLMQGQYNLFIQELRRLRDKSIGDAKLIAELAANLQSQLIISNAKNGSNPASGSGAAAPGRLP